MQIFGLVVGVALIGVGGATAIQHLVLLARRYKSVGALRLISLPAAWRFRLSLMFIAQGMFPLEADGSVGGWIVLGLWAALAAWQCTVWLLSRTRQRRPAAQ
jgi:hypothetical protein